MQKKNYGRILTVSPLNLVLNLEDGLKSFCVDDYLKGERYISLHLKNRALYLTRWITSSILGKGSIFQICTLALDACDANALDNVVRTTML